MLVAVRRYIDNEAQTVAEQTVYKSKRGYRHVFTCGDLTEELPYTKAALLDEEFYAAHPWLHLSETLIAIKRYDLDGLPVLETLHRSPDGYRLRAVLDGEPKIDEGCTFPQAMRWLNEGAAERADLRD